MKTNWMENQTKKSLIPLTLLSCLALQAEEGKKISDFFAGEMPGIIKDGKVLLTVNSRYEHVEQDPLKDANAFTVRTALGFETGKLYGFSGLLEAEDVSIIGNENNYNQAGLNPGGAGRAVVADPEGTEINRAWIGYENWDTKLKLGRQRIVLDNSRFIGNVVWRQNEQTYDGLSLTNKSLDDVEAFYSYIYNVNKIFGEDHPLGDFDSDSHLFHVSYSGLSFGKLTAYSYLLDFETDSPINSSDTFGVSFVGQSKITENWSAKYHAEYAYQMDAGSNPVDYEAGYLHLDAGAIYKKYDIGGGMEMLGSDNNKIGFSTPLATLHAFNGWADLFLTTPKDGLIDTYVYAGATLPYNIPLRVIYHEFEGDSGNMDYGNEWDAVASRKFGKHWSLLAKYANYSGSALPNRQVFWLQAQFTF